MKGLAKIVMQVSMLAAALSPTAYGDNVSVPGKLIDQLTVKTVGSIAVFSVVQPPVSLGSCPEPNLISLDLTTHGGRAQFAVLLSAKSMGQHVDISYVDSNCTLYSVTKPENS